MFGYCIIVLTVLWSNSVESSSIFDWLGWSDSKVPNLTYKGVPLLNIPFEELSPEDKFLVEASKIVGFELSELDACQHRLVIKLKSSCGSLSEEDLAKFSVNLLNCQSAVEGRQEFPCQENMSLKECTKAMDAETWNAYHIMNNRARAVCYASRQQQFRALAEMTVNKLMTTAHTHIEQLTSLQRESDSLKGSTSLTLKEIERSQRDVLTKQRSLASISLIISEEIQQTLTATNNQKILLADFRKDLTSLLSKLQIKLDNAEKQVGESAGSVKRSHLDLLNDMKEISNVAKQILDKIYDSSKRVVENNEAALEQFKEALANMKEINLSIGYILSVVETIKERSSLISEIVGEKGERLEMFVVISHHTVCLITAMIVSSFLSAPWTSRFFLLVTSSLNLYTSVATLTQSETNNYPRIDLMQFYCGFCLIALGDWLMRIILKLVSDKKILKPSDTVHRVRNDIVNNTTGRFDNKRNEVLLNHEIRSRTPVINSRRSAFDETPISTKVNSWLLEGRGYNNDDALYDSSNMNGYIKDAIHEDDDLHSHLSSSHRSIFGSKRSTDARMCTAISKATGQFCRKKALKSSNFCTVHDR